MKKTEFRISRHSVVHLDNYVVIIGGFCKYCELLPTDVIWMYNLYTEEWRKQIIPKHVIDKQGAPEKFYDAI